MVQLHRGIRAVVAVLRHADEVDFALLLAAVQVVGRVGQLHLEVVVLDALYDATALVDLGEVVEAALLDVGGEALDRVRPGQRVDRPAHADLLGDDLLRAQRDLHRRLARDRERLVVAVGVQRLRAAADGGQRLDRRAGNVVQRLARGARDARGLAVEPQPHRLGLLRAEPLLHHARPDAARGAEFGDLFQEVDLRDEEEREPRRELVDADARLHDLVDVRDPGGQRERDLLDGGRTCLARVVAADVDRVVVRQVLRREDDRVAHQPHRGPGRIDPLLLRDVLLDDVILDRPGEFSPVETALFGGDEVHRQQDPCRRVDRHRHRDLLEVDPGVEVEHVVDAVDRDALAPDLALAARIVRVVAHQRRHVEVGRDAGLALRDQVAEARVRVVGGAKTGDLAHRPRLRAVHRRVRPARVRELPREADVARVLHVGDVVRRVDALQRRAAQRAEHLARLGAARGERLERRLLPLAELVGYGLLGRLHGRRATSGVDCVHFSA